MGAGAGDVTHSVNEIEMLALKAARGAGCPAAQAAHFGRACVCHILADRPIHELTEALGALPRGPLLTLPITCSDSPTTVLEFSYVEAMATIERRPTLPARINCPAELFEHLQSLAQNTYVPASAASRESGAGAGLTDND